MISPKYSSTHYFHGEKVLKSTSFHVVNLYLDYNCRFSGILFPKLKNTVIPTLEKKYPSKFQFVFVNVIQPWHSNSTLLHEFSVVVAKFLREKQVENSNELFWDFSEAIFKNKEQFYDEANVDLSRNQIYEQIADLVFKEVKLPFSKNDVLKELQIQKVSNREDASNSGNGASTDLKYFTKYLRNVGVHVTPTVSVDGVVDNSISSGDSEEKLIDTFESYL